MSEREQERHVTVFHHLTLLRIPLLMQTVSWVFDVVWVLLIGQKYIDLCNKCLCKSPCTHLYQLSYTQQTREAHRVKSQGTYEENPEHRLTGEYISKGRSCRRKRGGVTEQTGVA